MQWGLGPQQWSLGICCPLQSSHNCSSFPGIIMKWIDSREAGVISQGGAGSLFFGQWHILYNSIIRQHLIETIRCDYLEFLGLKWQKIKKITGSFRGCDKFMGKSHWKLHAWFISYCTKLILNIKWEWMSVIDWCRVWYWLRNPANPVYASFMNMNICQYVKGDMALSLPGPLELRHTV